MKYRAEIDGLRALAVVPVILFHAGFELFSGGFVGVDVFFVISGYLITTILIEDLENQRFSLISFYERRARRILPALFFVIFVCIPFAWMWMLPSQMKDFSQSLVAVSLFASNVLFWRESGYFDAAAEEKPLLHTWSLAVEEQYYLLFPIFLFLAWRYGKNRIFWMIVAMASISLLLSEWGWRNEATANFYLAPTRAWELFAGSIAAFIVQKNGVRKNNLLALLGLAAIIFSIVAYDESTPFPSVYALVPVLGVVLLILYADKETIAARLLSTKIFVGVGLISYSAYLWHQPLFAFARIKSVNELSHLIMGMLALSSLLLAYCSWKYIETPFRNKLAINKTKIFIISIISILIFSAFGFIGHKTGGFFNYITTQNQRDILATAVSSPKRTECHTGDNDYLTYSESCEYFSNNITVAVLGDSHTVELAYALAERMQREGEGVKHLSFSSCVPSYQIKRDLRNFSNIKSFEDCSSWTSQAVDGLISDKRIETVIISYYIASSLYGSHEDTYPHLADERGYENRRAIWNSLLTLIETLENAGKRTLFVLQAPELPRPIGYLIPRENTSISNGVSVEWWNKRIEFVYENISELQRLTEIIDLSEIFCGEETCLAVQDGKALYIDSHHMSLDGARRAVEVIIPFIYTRDE
ncbi:acyltransferase [Ascidiaceihabitans sp.]|nr:acyltransferase [Ascidiaceihabitans sp.]